MADIPPVQRLDVLARSMNLEKELNRDVETIIPLNHWSRRIPYPAFDGMTITTPIFDFWYDHVVEEGMTSAFMATSSGGPNQAAGGSPVEAVQWQNNKFDLTAKIVPAAGDPFIISVATLFVRGGVQMQTADEPVIISTVDVTGAFTMTDRVNFVTGRNPMRYMQFQWRFNFSVTPANLDFIIQIGAKST